MQQVEVAVIMRPQRRDIGLAIVGCGTIGRIRAEFARDYHGIGWLRLCDTSAEAREKLAEDARADFFTTEENAPLKRRSAAEGHRNLLLTMAMDLSANAEIRLPLDLDELYR